MQNRKVRLFISYARADRFWKELLVQHLAVLVRAGTIEIWHDSDITPGTEWDPAIRQNIEDADLILFLVSPEFIASEYSWSVEVKRAMERHESRSAYVLPVIVRAVHWHAAPFAKLQALPRDGNPIANWTDPAGALADITRNIEAMANDMLLGRMPRTGTPGEAIPKVGDVHDDPISGMRFVWIPPGTFDMGWNPRRREGFVDGLLSATDKAIATPIHRVTITRGFWIGKYPVTQQVWKSMTGANGSHFEGSDRPVESVSWFECQEFMKMLNGKNSNFSYRLPSEAEWEYAARAGATDPLTGANPDEIAWYASNSGEQTHPVGLKKPNAWGLCDTMGNVWEWCADWYDFDHNYYEISPEIDPRGPAAGSFRISRGGAWYLLKARMHVAVRQWHPPTYSDKIIGLRSVMDAKST